MEKTPLAFRTHVSIFGNTNAGKSTLFNRLIGWDMAIVSDTEGTTTDPITKAMELLPFGPVALTDTAGLGDMSELGEKREAKTQKVIDKTDFAIYVADCTSFDESAYENFKDKINKKEIGHLLVFTKSDLGMGELCEKYPNAVCVSDKDDSSIEKLREVLINRLSETMQQEQTMIGDLLPQGSVIVMVIPIDEEAPKGRLILPQVQFLRDCLDHGMTAVCVRDTELDNVIKTQPHIDLVVTDSQAFKYVSDIVPNDIMLTSFSMLMANMKGDIRAFIDGANAVRSLKNGSRILIAEACTHNVSHEDIGRVKIPALLRKKTGLDLEFDYYVNHDFPQNIKDYDLVIHCGGCLINSRSMINRIDFCRDSGVPITNYGVIIAYLNDIAERSREVFGL